MMNITGNVLLSTLQHSDLLQHQQVETHTPIIYATIKPHQVLNT